MAKGSAFTRTMRFFREADYDEAKAALGRVKEIMEEREEVQSRSETPRRRKVKELSTPEPALNTTSESTGGGTAAA